MEQLQFGTFVFPHNPKELEMSCQPQSIRRNFASGGLKLELLGKGLRQIVCKGSFIGNSFAENKALWDRLQEEGQAPQILLLPGEPPFWAILAASSLSLQQDGRIVPYTLKFLEEEPYA